MGSETELNKLQAHLKLGLIDLRVGQGATGIEVREMILLVERSDSEGLGCGPGGKE